MLTWQKLPASLHLQRLISSSQLPAVGSSPDDFATLQQPSNGSVLLAGEAASDLHPGTLHGAYLSGQQQAERIVQARREALAAASAAAAAAANASSTGG